VSTEFLDRLASQLKVGKDPASRRAIERILDVIRSYCTTLRKTIVKQAI
jgi:hypothetical protein